MAGDAIAQGALQKGDQLVSFCLRAIREDFTQVSLKTRCGFVQAAPGGWDDGPNVLFWPPIAQFARFQIKHALPCAE